MASNDDIMSSQRELALVRLILSWVHVQLWKTFRCNNNINNIIKHSSRTCWCAKKNNVPTHITLTKLSQPHAKVIMCTFFFDAPCTADSSLSQDTWGSVSSLTSGCSRWQCQLPLFMWRWSAARNRGHCMVLAEGVPGQMSPTDGGSGLQARQQNVDWGEIIVSN